MKRIAVLSSSLLLLCTLMCAPALAYANGEPPAALHTTEGVSSESSALGDESNDLSCTPKEDNSSVGQTSDPSQEKPSDGTDTGTSDEPVQGGLSEGTDTDISDGSDSVDPNDVGKGSDPGQGSTSDEGLKNKGETEEELDAGKQEELGTSSNSGNSGNTNSGSSLGTSKEDVSAPSKTEKKTEQVFEKIKDGAYMIRSALGKNVDISCAGKQNGDNVQTWSNNYSAAQRFYLQAQGQGSSGEWYYTIKNVNSGKVLDCVSGKTRSGTNVQQYTVNGTDAQHWYLRKLGTMYQIVNVKSGLVLDVNGANNANGANIQIYRANNTLAQLWKLIYCTAVVKDGAYEIVSTLPGKRVLDVAGASAENGAAVQTYAANGTLAQAFSLAYEKSSGYYLVTNYGSGRVLDVVGSSASQGASVWQYASNGTRAQKWHIVKNEDGSFTFLSAIGGKALDVRGGKVANGALIQQYSRNKTKAQQFTLRATKPEAIGGIVMLRNGGNTYLVADVVNGSTAKGAKLQLYNANYTFAQKFQIAADKNGFCTIRMIGSGLYLVASESGSVSQKKPGGSSEDYLWSLVPTTTGHFSLLSSKYGFSLGLSGKAASGKALQGISSKQTVSTWNMLPVQLISDGCYTVASLKNAGLVLDVSGASLKNYANVRLWSNNGTNAQKFYLRHVGNGQYTVSNIWSGLRLDVRNGLAEAGNNIYQYGPNGTKAQKWTVKWDGAGGFIFKSALGSFSMGSSSNPNVGSNVYLKNASDADMGQRFKLSPTVMKPLTESDRIAVLNAISGWGFNVFKSMNSLSASTQNQIQRAISQYERNGKRVSFLMMDLKTGSGVSYDIDSNYYSASTIKGPYVAAVNMYSPWLLDAWGSVMYNIIDYSSNEDYAYLRDAIGSGPLNKLINETNADGFNASSHYVWYSSRDLAKLWVGMSEYLMSNRENASWCRWVFGNNSFITSRSALSWKGCPVYAKSGWLYGDNTVHNEGCLVMDGANPYLMVVMSTQPGPQSSYMSNLMNALDRAHGELI